MVRSTSTWTWLVPVVLCLPSTYTRLEIYRPAWMAAPEFSVPPVAVVALAVGAGFVAVKALLGKDDVARLTFPQEFGPFEVMGKNFEVLK